MAKVYQADDGGSLGGSFSTAQPSGMPSATVVPTYGDTPTNATPFVGPNSYKTYYPGAQILKTAPVVTEPPPISAAVFVKPVAYVPPPQTGPTVAVPVAQAASAPAVPAGCDNCGSPAPSAQASFQLAAPAAGTITTGGSVVAPQLAGFSGPTWLALLILVTVIFSTWKGGAR